MFLQSVGDLLGETFLNLQVPGEQLDDPGQFRQPENALAGQVTDMGDAVKGQQVMLARGLHGDAFCEHQIVVALVRECCQVELLRSEQLSEGVGNPARRI